MKSSPFSILRGVNTLVLAAGHGGGDPGAVGGGKTEAGEAIVIVDEMARLLTPVLGKGAVVVAPHADDTHETIFWVNKRYAWGTAWAIEVHRDSASIAEPAASWRCGVYHGASAASVEIARGMRTVLQESGAHVSTWARSHKGSRFGSLGWINQLRCLSHLMEFGFMQGRHDAAHINRLAAAGARAVAWAFAGAVLPRA